MKFDPSFGALRAQDLQQLKGEKKEAEKPVQDGGKGTTPQVETPEAEPITAGVLDAMAQQNIGLGIVNKKTPVVKGATEKIRHLDGYDELVTEWNRTNKNMSTQEKIDFLTQILSKVGNDRPAECKWGMLRTEFYIKQQEEAYEDFLEGLENGTINPDEVNYNNPLNDPNSMIFPGIFFPWAMHDYYHGGSIARELYGQEISEWPIDLQITNCRQRIAEYKMFIAQFNIQLQNPNLTFEELDEINRKIELYNQFLQDAEQQLRDLQSIILKEENETVQINNEPAAE